MNSSRKKKSGQARRRKRLRSPRESASALREIVRNFDYEIFHNHDEIGEVLDGLRWLATVVTGFDSTACHVDSEFFHGFGCVFRIMSNQLSHVNRTLDGARNFSIKECENLR